VKGGDRKGGGTLGLGEESLTSGSQGKNEQWMPRVSTSPSQSREKKKPEKSGMGEGESHSLERRGKRNLWSEVANSGVVRHAGAGGEHTRVEIVKKRTEAKGEIGMSLVSLGNNLGAGEKKGV